MGLNLFPQNKADYFLRMIRRSNRGRLKIFLGYGAGVGKTYQMLLEGHRLKTEGIDVVIGLLESHGRTDVESLAEGLEVVPRCVLEYRGISLQEMDVEAILVRKPQVALIDELAHTNVPGSPNAKRYEDVQDILESGIHIVTTLNIQHLESLYDTVEREIKIKVRERIPDSVLLEADDIVNVDLTPEDLRKRLKEGKIYPPDRIETALENFFKEANLETLRELTLRELASQIDLKRREHVEEEDNLSPDQVMVCLSSRGPNSEMLLRYGSRLAGRMNRNWYAVYVQTPSEAPTTIDLTTQLALSTTLTLAKQLGALVFTYQGEDVVATILSFAKEYRVGHIVVGSPGKISWWKRIAGSKNLVERLIEEAGGKTVVVLDTRVHHFVDEPEQPTITKKTGTGLKKISKPELRPLSNYLTKDRIVFWDQSITKEKALSDLLMTIEDQEIGDTSAVLDQLMKREQSSSTFFNEGVAFPHVRLHGLSNPIVALGVARHGVADSLTVEPIKLIFLILWPEEDPDSQVKLLGEISHAVTNRHLVLAVTNAVNSQEAFLAFPRWETERAANI